jgi:hypothetical protein
MSSLTHSSKMSSPYDAMPKTDGRTPLVLALALPKPHLYTNGPAQWWAQFWDVALQQMPVMYRNGENWLYPHHSESMRVGHGICSAATTPVMEAEFARLKAEHGLVEEDSSSLNDAKLVVHFQHPKLKKSLIQCDLTFKRFLGAPKKGNDGEDVEPAGYTLCPMSWGIGAHCYGFTYIHVAFSVVPKTKEMTAFTMDIANRKFMAA